MTIAYQWEGAQAILGALEPMTSLDMEDEQKRISIEPGGHPPAIANDIYVTIELGAIVDVASTDAEQQDFRKEIYEYVVRLNYRTGRFMPDRLANLYARISNAMEAPTREIITKLAGSWSVVSTLNNRVLTLGGEYGARTFLRLVNVDRDEPKTNDWSGEEVDSENVSSWLVRPIRFRGFMRLVPHGSD